MRDDREHDELDDFLKEKFSAHNMTPPDELWRKVKGELGSRKVVSYRKYRKLKTTLYISVAALAGIVLLLFANRLTHPSSSLNDVLYPNQQTAWSPYHETDSADNTEKLDPKNNAERSPTKIALTNTDRIKEVENTSAKLKLPGYQALAASGTPKQNDESKPIADHSILNTTKQNAIFSIENLKSKPIVLLTSPLETKALLNNKTSKTLAQKQLGSTVATHSIFAEKKISKKIEWEAYSLQKYTNRRIVNAADTDIATFTDETNNGVIALDAGIGVNYFVNEHFYLSTGIGQYQYKQKMKLNRNLFSSIDNQQFMVNTSVGTLQFSNSSYNADTSTANVQTNLNLLYGEIPFKIGFKISDRLAFEAGISYRRLLQTGIDFISTSNQEDLTFKRLDGLQKNNWGTNLGFYYQQKLTKHISFKIGAEAAYQLSALNMQTTQHLYPWSIGIKTAFVFTNL